MTSPVQNAAELLRECRHALAELTCTRLSLNLTSSGRGLQVRQLESEIHVLAASMAFASPRLLIDYLRWATSLPASVSKVQTDAIYVLRELQNVLRAEFPDQLYGIVSSFLEHALQSVRSASDVEETEPPAGLGERSSLQQEYLAFLLEARRGDALRLILDAVDSGAAIDSIYLDVLQPSQIEIGRLWQTGQITVAQEHYSTAATQFVMAHLHPYFFFGEPSNRSIVFTCVGSELHEVGLRIVSDLFELHGWNTVYLGANSPAESIAHSVVTNRANVLALSTTMVEHLFDLSDVLQIVRRYPGCEGAKIVVGGYPFNVDPFLWRRIGADGSAANAREAIRVVDRLVTSSDGRLQIAPSAPTAARNRKATGNNDLKDPDNTEDDLSRLNNSLITAQRELNQANVKLAALNKANEEKSAALQEADRRKDEFLAMLAHELRGPLAPMNYAIALLQADDCDAATRLEVTNTLARQTQQMAHLISDLLDASRITHRKIELKWETVKLQTAVERAIEVVQPLVREKRQHLSVKHGDAPILLSADVIRLTQVITNLLTNAAKYSDEEGQIWITSQRSGDKAVVVVRDNGIGIEPDVLPDVFSTFTQEQRSKSHSRGGLGLGLSLVKQLVELHGGTVTADSKGAGKGSSFSIQIPALEAAEASSTELHVVEPYFFERSDSAPSRRVLIVEDTAGLARIAACLFEKLGHQPFIATTGETAIQMYLECQPQIVTLDLLLPDMSGFDVAKAIRRLDQGDQTLIVAMTGHSDKEQQRLATESGCDEFLVKPFDVRVLKDLATHRKLMASTRHP